MRLVVGLGNPGIKYARTRHNVGFMVVEVVARGYQVGAWRNRFSARVAVAANAEVAFAMPQTYMNDSGESVAPIAAFHKVSPEDVLVICDDINLPFGRLRLRRRGSTGGHNGLDSIMRALHTSDFPRLRVGVGRAGMDTIGHVLGVFSPEEMEELPSVVERAAAGVRTFIDEGVDAAIALVNAAGGGLEDEEM